MPGESTCDTCGDPAPHCWHVEAEGDFELMHGCRDHAPPDVVQRDDDLAAGIE